MVATLAWMNGLEMYYNYKCPTAPPHTSLLARHQPVQSRNCVAVNDGRGRLNMYDSQCRVHVTQHMIVFHNVHTNYMHVSEPVHSQICLQHSPGSQFGHAG